jgi:hypothetical protein
MLAPTATPAQAAGEGYHHAYEQREWSIEPVPAHIAPFRKHPARGTFKHVNVLWHILSVFSIT